MSDGTFRDVRYFTCPFKKGLFVRLSSCQLGESFLGETAVNGYFGTLYFFLTQSSTVYDVYLYLHIFGYGSIYRA